MEPERFSKTQIQFAMRRSGVRSHSAPQFRQQEKPAISRRGASMCRVCAARPSWRAAPCRLLPSGVSGAAAPKVASAAYQAAIRTRMPAARPAGLDRVARLKAADYVNSAGSITNSRTIAFLSSRSLHLRRAQRHERLALTILSSSVFALADESRKLFTGILVSFALFIVVGFNAAWWFLRRYSHALVVGERRHRRSHRAGSQQDGGPDPGNLPCRGMALAQRRTAPEILCP
jgi:hypothetical protein